MYTYKQRFNHLSRHTPNPTLFHTHIKKTICMQNDCYWVATISSTAIRFGHPFIYYYLCIKYEFYEPMRLYILIFHVNYFSDGQGDWNRKCCPFFPFIENLRNPVSLNANATRSGHHKHPLTPWTANRQSTKKTGYNKPRRGRRLCPAQLESNPAGRTMFCIDRQLGM